MDSHDCPAHSDDALDTVRDDDALATRSALETARRKLNAVARGRPFISLPESMLGTGHSRASTYRLANAGRLPTVKGTGRMRRVSVVALERYLCGEIEP